MGVGAKAVDARACLLHRGGMDLSAEIASLGHLLRVNPASRALYGAYERALLMRVHAAPVPKHIGIIMDGNRRMARAAGRLPWEGHELGADAVEALVDWCGEIGIHTLTLYAFSTENFARPQGEVDALMSLFARKLTALATHARIHADGVRVRVLGRRELLPKAVREAAERVERATAHHSQRALHFCIAYGGRQEMADAVRSIVAKVVAGELAPEAIDDDTLGQHLYVAGDDPDLIIRTGGESRLSNFLLYQSAYAELFFSDVYFPSFRRLDLIRIVRAFQKRQRRFGS